MKTNKILIALPQSGFDPTECISPWLTLSENGCEVTFITPLGKPAKADSRMICDGFGPLSPFLMTHPFILHKYSDLQHDESFLNPLSYSAVSANDYTGLVIPGGHGDEMRSLLDSLELHQLISDFFEQNKPVGAICTGVLAVARSLQKNGKSVLYGRKTTAVTKLMELTGWFVTAPWLKRYFRPYPRTIQEEIINFLQKKQDFLTGPLPLFPSRYSKKFLSRQFVVIDKNYLSARWPGDAYRFSLEFLKLLNP